MSSKNGNTLVRIGYNHEMMIDAILLNPKIGRQELAEQFGVSRNWLTRILSSDAFKARFHERRKEVMDPRLKAAVTGRAHAMAIQSIDKVQKSMDASDSAEVALQALGLSGKLLQKI